jgi:predicted RNA-binding protein with PUA-like domain
LALTSEEKSSMKYWLLKSDPEEFTWQDLKKTKNQITCWDGVRNYQARNYLKEMKKNDLAFFYHSVVDRQTIMGVVKIVKEAYPDHTQFEHFHDHFDPKSTKEAPRWFMVDIQYVEDFNPPITRNELKNIPKLREMVLFKNSRLSIQPITNAERNTIQNLRSKK